MEIHTVKTFDINNRRYLGSKYKLLDFISSIVSDNCTNCKTFADIFSGTGVVAYKFISEFNIIVNDILKSNNYVYQTFFGSQKYDKDKIVKIIKKYNKTNTKKDNYYSLNFSNTYLSKNNMRKVGVIRDNIDKLYNNNEINDREKAILITSLIYAIDKVANTVGHYDSYIENGNFDNQLILLMPNIVKHKNKTFIYNLNANELVKNLYSDIVYIDPPYNSRQYSDAYHFLENVANNAKPKVFGKAKKMNRSDIKSKYCTSKASIEFEELIDNLKCKYILVSYNNTAKTANDRSNAKISDTEITRILNKKGKVKVYEKEHNQFSAGKSNLTGNKERVFFCEVGETKDENIILPNKIVQSPLNYTGGKYKIFNQLKQFFPKDISTFYDLFCGGCNVGVNIDNANNIVCIDNNHQLIELLNYLKETDYKTIFDSIEKCIKKYNLSDSFRNGYEIYSCNSANGLGKFNKNGYLMLRNDYNKTKKIELFLILIIYGFNNQIRFNNNGEFNLPVGKRDFNSSLRNKLLEFTTIIKNKKINFICDGFDNVNISKLKKTDFIYCDPPYYLGDATYNENGGWNLDKEKQLLDFLKKCNDKSIKFALSNVIEHKGKKHELLIDWTIKNQFNINYIEKDYSNSNYHKKSRNSITKEVLITNY